MKRRTLLKSVACASAMGFAGCLGSDAGGGNGADSADTDNSSGVNTDTNRDDGTTDGNEKETDDETTDTDETRTDSDDETADSDGRDESGTKQRPILVDNSFEIVSSGCGTKKRAINASFTDHTVRITGVIRGKNSCYTAELTNVTCEQDTLTATVRSFESERSGMCAMCLKNIEYESTHTFEGGLPKRIVVTHNDERVLKTKR